MKLARGELPSQQYIVDLLDAAREGDNNALQEARSISMQLAKRANVRLADLEEADFEASPAYIRVRDIIGEETRRLRFKEGKNLSYAELETQLEELSIFLRDETSRVAGEKMRRTGIDTMINEGTIKIKDERTKRALARFLASDEWNAYRKLAGYVKGSMKTIVNAIENGNTIKDFNRLYEDAKAQIAAGENLDLLGEWEKM